MQKKQRDKALKNADAADTLDKFWYLFLLAWSVGAWVALSAENKDPGYWPAVGFVLVGLIRIRMIARAIRVDALLREAEEEARR